MPLSLNRASRTLVVLFFSGVSIAQVYSSTSGAPPSSSQPSQATKSQGQTKSPAEYWGTTIPPRVFVTDSESWQIVGSGGGSSAGFASEVHGGARPQTAEIIKTFGERCPEIKVNNIKEKTDYVVVLDHEGGKGYLRHRNKVAVFARISGDSVFSKSTLSLGGSVQDACEAINADWILNGAKLRDAAAAEEAAKVRPAEPATVLVAAPPASLPSSGKATILSDPDAADIEVDGAFVGNTPSDVQVSEGEHTVTVKKAGFKDWERKLKVSAGSSIRLNATLEKAETVANPPSQQ